MAFALSIIEFVLVPATMISAGVWLIVDYANNKTKSHTIFKSNKDPILNNVKKIDSKILEINNSSTNEIENKFKDALSTSEKITRNPITFSYDPKNSNDTPIKAQISFVLEPDSTNWKEAETIDLSLSTIYTIKRWIPKNHTDSNGLPECRYSWSSSIENSSETNKSGMATKFLENLKKLINSANNSCKADNTKGLTKEENKKE